MTLTELVDLDINYLTLDLARQMLIYECDLRKSEYVQNLYTYIQNGKVTDIELIEDYVQFSTIEKFGYDTSKNSLINYRLINAKFGHDVHDYAFYLKYNIMKNELMPGTIINTDDIKLINISDNSKETFSNVAIDGQLSLIFSGSIT